MSTSLRELGSLVFLSTLKERILCASFRIGCLSCHPIRSLLTIVPTPNLTTITIPLLTITLPLNPTIPTITPLTLTPLLIRPPTRHLFIMLPESGPQLLLLKLVPLQDRCSNQR